MKILANVVQDEIDPATPTGVSCEHNKPLRSDSIRVFHIIYKRLLLLLLTGRCYLRGRLTLTQRDRTKSVASTSMEKAVATHKIGGTTSGRGQQRAENGTAFLSGLLTV